MKDVADQNTRQDTGKWKYPEVGGVPSANVDATANAAGLLGGWEGCMDQELGGIEFVISETQRKHAWRVSEVVGIGFVLFPGTLALYFMLSRKLRYSAWASELSRYQLSMLSNLFSILTTCTILMPFIVSVVQKRMRSDWRNSVEWNFDGRVYKYIGFGALFAILYQLALRMFFGTAGSFSEYPLALSLILYIISTVIAQAIVEEWYFRGVLFLALEDKYGGAIAIVTVTVLFAFMHPLHKFYILPVAIALGVVRLKERSLAACFAFHAAYNLFLALFQIVAPS